MLIKIIILEERPHKGRFKAKLNALKGGVNGLSMFARNIRQQRWLKSGMKIV